MLLPYTIATVSCFTGGEGGGGGGGGGGSIGDSILE